MLLNCCCQMAGMVVGFSDLTGSQGDTGAWSPPGILKVLVLGSVSTPTACFLCLREVKPLGYMGSASR